jgi:hypothetical protein
MVTILDGFVGAAIGGFEPALGALLGTWAMVETAVGTLREDCAPHDFRRSV